MELNQITPTPQKTLDDISKIISKQDKKGQGQGKDQGEKIDSRRSSKADLGHLDVEKYLTHYGVEYNVKKESNRTFYRIRTCLFDPSHGKNDAAIVQSTDGKLTYQCFHDHCNHTWKQARELISGADEIRQFHAGYDPNWKPRYSGPKPLADDKPFLRISEKGRVTFVPAFLSQYLKEKYTPLLNEGVDFGALFYHYTPEGLWKLWPEAVIEKECVDVLEEHAMNRRIADAIGLLKKDTFIPEEKRKPNPMWLNLQNCMLNVQTMETAPHSPSFHSTVQLPVIFKEGEKCPLWIETLEQIFEDDFEKGFVLQDFFGYCLYPALPFPCAIFQIGGGANGKGTVQRALEAMLGDDNVSHISLTRMEEKFGPVELKDKLLNTCGETSSKPLEVTQFKAIAAGDKVQAEVKYKPDIIFMPFAKHLISMNEFPGIKDKTDAFFRRVIVMEYKQQFLEEKDDRHLSEKLLKENNGIFMWALEGLKRVIENDAITMPDSVIQAKKRFRARVNPVLMFVDEECLLDSRYDCIPKELYKGYVNWCEEAKTRPLGKQRFYEQILTGFKVQKVRPTNKSQEVFIGIAKKEDVPEF